MLDRNIEYQRFGADKKENTENPLKQWVDMAKQTNSQENGKGNVENREFAIKQLEQKFSKVSLMKDEDVQYVFNNVDESTRKRLMDKIVDSYGLKGEVKIQDMTGKMLTVELDTPPIQYEDEQHGNNGWVFKYKTWDTPQNKHTASMKTNYISSLARFKEATPKIGNSEGTYYKKAA